MIQITQTSEYNLTQTSEYQLIQNPALGALCLWFFVRKFWSTKNEQQGPHLMLATTVLPIVFHEESVRLLCRRRFEGGLLNARTDDRTLGIGLQSRISDMLDQSFSSLDFAFASNLLGYDSSQTSIIPSHTGKLFEKAPIDQAQMFWTAERLGFWFATLPLDQVCSHLRISL